MITYNNEKPVEQGKIKRAYKWIKAKLYSAYTIIKRYSFLIVTLIIIAGLLYWRLYL